MLEEKLKQLPLKFKVHHNLIKEQKLILKQNGKQKVTFSIMLSTFG